MERAIDKIKNIRNRKWLLLAVFVLLLSFTYGIAKNAIWLDEACSFHIAKEDPFLLQASIKEPHPPLYFLFLHYWMSLLGNSVLAMRSLSLLFALGAVPFIVKTTKKCWDKNHARLSLWVLGFSPMVVYYAQEARMYSLLFFFASMTVYSVIAFKPQKKNSRLVLLSFTLVGAAYTHVYGFVLFPAIIGMSLFLPQKQKKENAVVLITALLFSSPRLIAIWQQAQLDLNPWIEKQSVLLLPRMVVSFFCGYSADYPNTIHRFLFADLAIFAVMILFLIYSKDRIIKTLLSGLLAGVVFFWSVSVFKPIYVPGRYDIVLYPFFVMILTRYIFNMWQHKKKIIACALFLPLIAGTLHYHFVFYKSNDDKVAAYIQKNAGQGDSVIACELNIAALDYYLPDMTDASLLEYPRTFQNEKRYIDRSLFEGDEDAIEKEIEYVIKKTSGSSKVWVTYCPTPFNNALIRRLSAQRWLRIKKDFAAGDVRNQMTSVFTFGAKKSNAEKVLD